jgi:DNA (cytosine-5)-methyltransferase 1
MLAESNSVASLFSGLGGLDLGAHMAGLRTAIGVDRDAEALELLRSALGSATMTVDLEEAGARDKVIEEISRVAPRFIIGGPPCTAFSHAGFWIADKRAGHDPAAQRIDDFVAVVRVVRPEAFVLENVPGLAFRTHERFLHAFINRARRAGYSVAWQILDASHYGVAQARRRLFIVGIRSKRRFVFPAPHSVIRTSGWAIADLEDLGEPEPDEVPTGRWGQLVPLVPPGENYLAFTTERGCAEPLFKYRGRYWSFLLKLDPKKVSPTIPAQRVTYNGPFHWRGRHLRVREMARLQGLPDWYPLATDLTTARRHIGNAVPPPLSASILWQLRRQLGDVADQEMPPPLLRMTDPSSGVRDVSAEAPVREVRRAA